MNSYCFLKWNHDDLLGNIFRQKSANPIHKQSIKIHVERDDVGKFCHDFWSCVTNLIFIWYVHWFAWPGTSWDPIWTLRPRLRIRRDLNCWIGWRNIFLNCCFMETNVAYRFLHECCSDSTCFTELDNWIQNWSLCIHIIRFCMHSELSTTIYTTSPYTI